MNKHLLSNNFFKILNGGVLLLLLLFLSSLVIGKYVGKGYEHAFLLIGLIFIIFTNLKGIVYSKIEERLILFGISAYLLALMGYVNQHDELTRFAPVMEAFLSTWIPLALFSMLYVVKIRRLDFFVSGLVLAVWVATGITAMALFKALPRGGGNLHGAAIIFGDLSMLFGILAIIFSAFYIHKKLFYLLLITGLLGIASSLFSGTKGGWIVLVTLPFFLTPVIPKQYRYKTLLSFLGLMLVVVCLVIFTENNIKLRMLSAYGEVNKLLFTEGYTGGSLGSRIELWRISIMAFASNPLSGIGVGEFYAFKMPLVDTGEVSREFAHFKHSHNEYLSILSSMGLIGMTFYTVFFVWLLRVFTKAMRSNIKEVKFIGIAGVSTIICYLDFSLSESFLSSHLGGAAFYFLMTFFVYFIQLYTREPQVPKTCN